MVTRETATETERVRNTLLASVSHDFRTPLSSILGAATSLIDYGDKLDAERTKDLLGQIKTEAEGLDEMVRNLLAITRIDAGALELRRDWIDLREIVERVVERGAPPRRARRRSRSTCRRSCRWCVPTPRWSSRRSATSSPMPSSHTPTETPRDGRRADVDGDTRRAARDRRRARHCGGGVAARLRQVRQGAASAGADGGRARARPCHCQRHHGGAWRRDRGGEPGRRRARRAHHA